MKDLSSVLNIGLCFIGYIYIMFKTGQWFASNVLKQWDKRRKDSQKQKAVNALYEAYELDKVTAGETVKLATKSGLLIMIYRQDSN